MRVVHIASEFAHLAKAGGLGDVLYGLAKKQVDLGLSPLVFLPKYSLISLSSKLVKKTDRASYYAAEQEGVAFIFIEIESLFSREQIYGYPDDPERFLSFCLAAYEFLPEISPSLLHLHDWPTAVVALLNRKSPSPLPTLFTIHNLQYQGLCDPSLIKKLAIAESCPLQEFSTSINLLKWGIHYSDLVTTVSPQYAKEILTPDYGCGLESFLQDYRHKLVGILNGIDEHYWNPSYDPFLPHHLPKNFGVEELMEWKHFYRKNLNLPLFPEKPLLVAITRLTSQKNPELIEHALIKNVEHGGQSYLLGSTHEREIQENFDALTRSYSDEPNLRLELKYDESLSHQLYAAADFIVIPSHFEPCGLTQMIARRYGTLPIVRKTGGLADTVQNGINGFTFNSSRKDDLEEALDAAFKTFEDKPRLQKMVEKGLSEHHDWSDAAQEYLKLYQKIKTSSSS